MTWVALALLLTGLVVGTLEESVPDPMPRRAGGYWILAADFHVHAFPGDGALRGGRGAGNVRRLAT